MDRRDSLGVCVDNRKGAESLQRDQAVCISTNGTLTHTRTGLAASVPELAVPRPPIEFNLPCRSCPGAVFVNGKEMTNQLPAITVGSAVTFDMEVVNMFPSSSSSNDLNGGSFKLRVTIGSGSREVVFDWLVDQAVDSLFFGSSFVHSGWKVLVY